jgi:hypothetical protein
MEQHRLRFLANGMLKRYMGPRGRKQEEIEDNFRKKYIIIRLPHQTLTG